MTIVFLAWQISWGTGERPSGSGLVWQGSRWIFQCLIFSFFYFQFLHSFLGMHFSNFHSLFNIRCLIHSCKLIFQFPIFHLFKFPLLLFHVLGGWGFSPSMPNHLPADVFLISSIGSVLLIGHSWAHHECLSDQELNLHKLYSFQWNSMTVKVRIEIFNRDRNFQARLFFFNLSALPCKPTPPKFRGCHFTPKFWGWSVRSPLFFFCVFWGSPPKFKGWNWHPPNLGGMGWQG